MKNLLLLLLTANTISVFGQTWTQSQKMVSNDREVNDEYGNAVAIDGNYAIVGAKLEDDDANGWNDAADAGSVYILRHNPSEWVQELKLAATDRQSHDYFGSSVDISGDYCIVGAPQEGTIANTGAAYIFHRVSGANWLQVAKLEAPIQKANDYFGFSVGISGGFAVVGAYFEDEDENEANLMLSSGSAYIFQLDTLDNWGFYQKIVASDRSGDDRFGKSVAIGSLHIVVGSEFDDIIEGPATASNAGSAYIFKFNGINWEEEAHITASDYGQSENFGWSVAVSGYYAIVGAYKNDTDELGLNDRPDAGAAYIYERGNGLWPQVKKVVASDRAEIDYYGYNVAIDSNRAVVGAYRQNFGAPGNAMFSDAGAAYVIERDASGEWAETQKINHGDRASLDLFGICVAIDGEDIIVGAMLEDEDENIDNPLPDAGSVYLFSYGPTSVNDIEQIRFSIYPNPATEQLTILCDKIIISYEIFDLMGRSIMMNPTVQTSKFSIDLSDIIDGAYLLRLNGEKVIRFSLIR